MGRDGLHDVVLEEEPEPSDGGGAARRPRGHGGDRAAPGSGTSSGSEAGRTGDRAISRLRAHRVPLTLAAVVLLGVSAGAVDAVRERERAARIGAVPRVLDPLDPSLAEAWSVPGGWEHSLILGPAATIGEAGLTIAVFPADDGAVLVANDLDTGAELWRAPLPALRARPRDDVGCRVLGDGSPPARATHVVCRFVVPLTRGADRPSYGPGAEARLLVLDADTGEPVTERSLGVGFGAMDAVGRDVVLVDIQPDGRPVVTREDPVTGEVHWTFHGDIPMPRAGLGAGPPARPSVVVQGDVVTVIGPVSWALSADGRELGRWSPGTGAADSFVDVAVLPDGRFAVGTVSPRPEPGRVTDVRVVAPGTRDDIRLPAGVTLPVVDDGSAPDLLLTDSPDTTRIAAVDRRTGQTRWARDYGFGFGDVLVLDRRMIQADHGRVVAVDTGTGSVLWSALEGELRPYQQLLTDGDVVLVPTGPDGRPTTLHALDVEDGRTRWTATGPEDVVAFLSLGGRLVALQQQTTILLR